MTPATRRATADAIPQGLPSRLTGQKIADWIFQCLKGELIDGTITAHEILVEGAVAERFGVSRGPAREALQQLRRTGLVNALPRVGYLVTGVSLRDFNEVFQMRLVLEPLATELATERIQRRLTSPDRLLELAAAVDRVDEGSGDRGGQVAELNHDFHLEIATLSGNRRLRHALAPLLDDMSRVMRALAYDEPAYGALVHDHPTLVDCMLNGEPAAARDLMRNQLEQSYDVLAGFAIGADINVMSRRDG